MLVAKDLSKSYGSKSVLKDCSFTLSPGSINFLTGANGSGKSTLLKVCAGLLTEDKGSILFNNTPIQGQNIGYIGHAPGLYADLTVLENLNFFIRLRGKKLDPREGIEEWGLSKFKDTRVKDLSEGLRYRTALCRTLLCSPKIIFFDEPSASLDHKGVSTLLNELDKLLGEQKDSITLLASHDIERLAPTDESKIFVLEKGKIR